ncbi:MAG: response regulator [Deltaproteobacteria bacterium]|nr:response regulator [Deltaproteobacteria bacterium]
MALIFVLDDSAFALKATSIILSGGGYETLLAEDEEDFFKALKDDSKVPDCIVLDLLMPGKGGIEILKELKESGVTIPVVVQTADIQKSVREKCLEMGAVEVVNKPPQSKVLLSAIKKAIEG